jgi:tol-pal system protein YbgF
MKHTLVRTALVTFLFSGLAVPAPVMAADKETRQMMADIRMLQEQLQLVQNLFGSTIESLKALNARIDQQVETNRKSFADQKLTIDAVAGDLRIVRERMDDNNVRIGSLTQEVDALRQTVLQLNVGSPAPPPIDSGDPAAAASGAPPALPPSSGAPAIAGGMSPQRAFDMAKADFLGGQYELAISGLEAYVRTFPKSEQAAEAQLLVGTSYSQLGKNDKAVEAFDLTIRTYPRSSSIPEAYYRKGVALQSLRQLDEARAAYEWVMKNSPDGPEATLAKQRIDGLTRTAAPVTRKP